MFFKVVMDDISVIFQSRYELLNRSFVTYTSGEKLFGMSPTEYPILQHFKKELTMLQKLYGLYNVVVSTINGYYDILWSDIDVEKINGDLAEFQNK